MRTLILATLIVPLTAGTALAQGHGLEAFGPCNPGETCNNSSPGTIGNGYHVQAPAGTPIWDGSPTSDAMGVAAGVMGTVAGFGSGNPAAAVAGALGLGAAVSNAANDGAFGTGDTSSGGFGDGNGGVGTGAPN